MLLFCVICTKQMFYQVTQFISKSHLIKTTSTEVQIVRLQEVIILFGIFALVIPSAYGRSPQGLFQLHVVAFAKLTLFTKF